MSVFKDNVETIGRSPLVQINRLAHGLKATVLAKIEGRNPAYSVKCRLGAAMIWDAEEKGILSAGSKIVEPTSGNTGIGLAMVAAVKGYRAIFVMSEDMSSERKQILLAYGAELVLTPADKGTIGAIEEARRLSEEKGYFFVGQHYNPANPAAHQITANEIYEDFGEKLDAIVCTTGTGGTISGLSTYLKDRIPDLMIIATEPEDSPILSKGIACKHKIMGTAPGFIPDTLDQSAYDDIIPVSTEAAFQSARKLATDEGIFCGISCGAAVAGMLDYASKESTRGAVLLAILPDTGERYLSTDLWA